MPSVSHQAPVAQTCPCSDSWQLFDGMGGSGLTDAGTLWNCQDQCIICLADFKPDCTVPWHKTALRRADVDS